MSATINTINETGINEILGFLSENHKRGGDFFTQLMLSAWASGAEESMDAGNPPMVEIPARDSVTGCPVTYTVSPAGVSETEVDFE